MNDESEFVRDFFDRFMPIYAMVVIFALWLMGIALGIGAIIGAIRWMLT